MTELVTSGSVGGMASNGCLYPEIREVQSLNDYFAATGYSDLEARAYASTASGSPWYMISIGSWHTSREEAENTFRRAKHALGPKMRKDAYIYSTKNISPVHMLIRYVRRFFSAVKGFFTGLV